MGQGWKPTDREEALRKGEVPEGGARRGREQGVEAVEGLQSMGKSQ